MFLQINDLNRFGVGFYEISILGSYKVLNTIFEMQSGYPEFWFLVVLKCYS